MNKIDLRGVDLNLLPVFQVLMEERHVSRAAERLGRTQSAASHALERLREQLNDPLLIRVGGAMEPTAYGLEVFDEIGPILQNIQRVLSTRESFAPQTSNRVFNIVVPDFWAPSVAAFIQTAQAEAPGVAVAWSGPRENSLLDLANQQVDLVVAPSRLKAPDGVESQSIGGLSWGCFMRKGHPALDAWGIEDWQAYPHIVVTVGDRLPSPIQVASLPSGVSRRVGVHVPTFAAVPPLLARSNMVATLPHLALGDGVVTYGLTSRAPPFLIAPIDHSLFWSARRARDAATRWLIDRLRPALIAEMGTNERRPKNVR
jgi:DNA-binding transcriptional LysR family regulator